jgi:3-oxoacyl-[acyl-carrier-protein] synthase-3
MSDTAPAAVIRGIEYFLPEGVESSADLAAEFPDWAVGKIAERTGINTRHIAGPNECASDLAIAAANKLFASGRCVPSDIDFILFCTQTPDYLLPTTACVMQHRLGIPVSAGALDFNLGSSGFVYGLMLAKGLIETGAANNVLLLTADTYSKLIHPADKSVRTIFGDGAAATLVSGAVDRNPAMGPFVFGSDGSGAANLMVPAGGMREPKSAETARAEEDSSGNVRTRDHLFMDGGEIFAFTLRSVPKLLTELLAKSGKTRDDIDLYFLHQPNRAMLDTLRKQLRVPPERLYIHLEECGNTVAASIPIALKAAEMDGTLRPGALVALLGFGGGYSWCAALVRWI